MSWQCNTVTADNLDIPQNYPKNRHPDRAYDTPPPHEFIRNSAISMPGLGFRAADKGEYPQRCACSRSALAIAPRVSL